MENNNTQEFLSQYGEEVIARLIAKLRQSGHVASGRLLNSLKDEVVDGVNFLELKIKGEDYFQNIVDGRKPGNFPPIGPLKQWAKTKGIPATAVFPIAKSIYKLGIKPDPSFTDLTPTFKSGLNEGVEKAMAEDIKQELKNIKNNVQNS